MTNDKEKYRQDNGLQESINKENDKRTEDIH